MKVTFELTAAQLDDFIKRVADEIAGRPGQAGTYSVEEAADLLKLHPRTVKRRIQAGTIPKISGLGRPRIPAKWLDQKLNPNPDE